MSSLSSAGRVLLSREAIDRRVRQLAAEITADHSSSEPLLVVGILKGAVVFLSDLIRVMPMDVRLDFMAVASYGASTRSSGVVRILKDLDESVEGRHVLIVEDIVDTGLTLHYLRETLAGRGPASIRVCVLLDKPSRREIDVRVDYTGFSIPDEFVVGYGLDCGGRYRNLPHIAVLDGAEAVEED